MKVRTVIFKYYVRLYGAQVLLTWPFSGSEVPNPFHTPSQKSLQMMAFLSLCSQRFQF